jgi:hypothetical protein
MHPNVAQCRKVRESARGLERLEVDTWISILLIWCNTYIDTSSGPRPAAVTSEVPGVQQFNCSYIIIWDTALYGVLLSYSAFSRLRRRLSASPELQPERVLLNMY